MKSPSPVIVALALGSILVIMQPAGTAHACSCAETAQPEAFEQATSVFEGRVLELVSEDMEVLVRLEVVRTWKGADAEAYEVRTRRSSAACGYGFDVGQSYLVYTHGEAGDERVGLCSRTQRIEAAEEDIVAMGEGITPVNPHGEGEHEPYLPEQDRPASGGCASCSAVGNGSVSPVAAGLGLLLLGAAFWRRRG